MFYVAGFDPRGAEFYHRLYQDDATRQSEMHALAQQAGQTLERGLLQFSVGPLEADDRFDANWTVDSRPVAGSGGAPDAGTQTRYTFLGWDDLARANTRRGLIRALATSGSFYRALWSSRSGAGAWTHSKRFFWSMLTPLLWLVLVVAAAALLAWGMVAAATALGAAPALAWTLGGLGGVAVLVRGWRLALRWRYPWLLDGLHYYLQWGLGLAPELDARLDGFARSIAQEVHELRARGDDCEVLMVGHCMGSSMAPTMLERVLRELDARAGTAGSRPIKLLTLANVIPMVSLVRGTDRVARAVNAMSGRQVPWLDYTSPHDPLCYALVDCEKLNGAAPEGGSGRPSYRPRSARFDKMFAPADYAMLKRDPFRMHFQYLMASDVPVDNDFFTLTAGPWPLEHWIAPR